MGPLAAEERKKHLNTTRNQPPLPRRNTAKPRSRSSRQPTCRPDQFSTLTSNSCTTKTRPTWGLKRRRWPRPTGQPRASEPMATEIKSRFVVKGDKKKPDTRTRDKALEKAVKPGQGEWEAVHSATDTAPDIEMQQPGSKPAAPTPIVQPRVPRRPWPFRSRSPKHLTNDTRGLHRRFGCRDTRGLCQPKTWPIPYATYHCLPLPQFVMLRSTRHESVQRLSVAWEQTLAKAQPTKQDGDNEAQIFGE